MTVVLTARQREVLTLVGMGYTMAEIGDELGVSPRTAKQTCDRLRVLYGVAKKRQLIPIARRET